MGQNRLYFDETQITQQKISWMASHRKSAPPFLSDKGNRHHLTDVNHLTHMRFAYTVHFMNTWDEAKRVKNLADHGIDFADLDDFFLGDLLTREDARYAYGELRLQSIGLCNGVVLFVAWTPRGKDGGIDHDIPHLISARKAVSHEQKAWFQRYHKR